MFTIARNGRIVHRAECTLEQAQGYLSVAFGYPSRVPTPGNYVNCVSQQEWCWSWRDQKGADCEAVLRLGEPDFTRFGTQRKG